MTNIAVRVMSNALDSLLEARLSTDIRQQLAIAEATHGRSALEHPAFQQGPHLGDESALDLTSHPVIHGPIKSIARHSQANLDGFKRGWTLALLSRHGDSGFLVDLQGTNDATKVAAGSR